MSVHYADGIFNSFSPDQRKSVIESLKASQCKLENENEIFEKFKCKVELDQSVDELFDAIPENNQRSFSGRCRSLSSTGLTRRYSYLTAKQKCKIAQNVSDEIRRDMLEKEKKFERIIHNYQAHLQVADIRLTELKKAISELSELFESLLLSRKSTSIINEELNKFQQNYSKKTDKMLQHCQADNLVLKLRLKTLQKDLHQKIHYGGSTNPVDVTYSLIRCSKGAAQFRELTNLIAKTKLMYMRQTQKLDKPKRALERGIQMTTILRDQIHRRFESLATIRERISGVNMFQNSSPSTDLEAFKDYRIPTVTEFIDVYLELKRLSLEEKVLKRKLDSTKIIKKMHRRAWSKVPK